MTGSTNRIVFLLSVREREGIRNIKKMTIAEISMKEKGGVRNVR